MVRERDSGREWKGRDPYSAVTGAFCPQHPRMQAPPLLLSASRGRDSPCCSYSSQALVGVGVGVGWLEARQSGL